MNKSDTTEDQVETNFDPNDKNDETEENEDAEVTKTDVEIVKSFNFNNYCPWCGQQFTSSIRLQLHLLLYPRIKVNCQATANELVTCSMCKKDIMGKYFDVHPCIFDIIEGLNDLGIDDQPLRCSEAQDYCFLCKKCFGCRFNLLSHLIVYHFPYAKEKQCGFCGSVTTEMQRHQHIHRAAIMDYCQLKIGELMSKTKEEPATRSLSLGFLGCCKPDTEFHPRPADIFLYFVKPNTCLLCTHFIGNQTDLLIHILWDWHESTHKSLRTIQEKLFTGESGLFHCRFCGLELSTYIGHTCFPFWNIITKTKIVNHPTLFLSSITCLLCWHRNNTHKQLLAHIPCLHNLNIGWIGLCGICFEKSSPAHSRYHEDQVEEIAIGKLHFGMMRAKFVRRQAQIVQSKVKKIKSAESAQSAASTSKEVSVEAVQDSPSHKAESESEQTGTYSSSDSSSSSSSYDSSS